MRIVVAAGGVAATLYTILAGIGDLQAHVEIYLACHALLVALMLIAWRAVAWGGPAAFRTMFAAAVVFRLIAAAAPPSLSDDVYRCIWDGRLQAAGHHPYRFAPSDPARAELRDEVVYPKIVHPEVPTLHPPLAQMVFAALAIARCGVTGFKLAFALLDVAVVLLMLRLLRTLRLPKDRIVLYAWNPLAVIEIAGSGHVEPLGMALLVVALAFLVEGRATIAGAALGSAIQANLLPLILVPGFTRRMKIWSVFAMIAVVALTTMPYALRGPWYGASVLTWARRAENGPVIFAGVRRFFEWADLSPSNDAIAWAQARLGAFETGPDALARFTVAIVVLVFAVVQSFRPRVDVTSEARLAIGGALLLSPALHPWYVLWVLPLAAIQLSGGWLLLGALVPLQYLAGVGEIAWWIRWSIFLPSSAWMLYDALIRSRR
jgi:hypothetical protein